MGIMPIVEHPSDYYRNTRAVHYKKLENYSEESRSNYVWILSCVPCHCVNERKIEYKRESRWIQSFPSRIRQAYPENKSNGQYLLSCCTSRPLIC